MAFMLRDYHDPEPGPSILGLFINAAPSVTARDQYAGNLKNKHAGKPAGITLLKQGKAVVGHATFFL
jgi:hypothetical protein